MPPNSKYMELALRIAFEHLGKTSPNPSVGAVIVKNGNIISTGGTCPSGSDHAEIDAIKKADVDLNGAEIYISLEPCSHHGMTPPCTDAIIRSGFSKVYIPILDPNPVVAGKGVDRLKNAGICVIIMHEMADYAVDIIRHFEKYILKDKPFIINKSAVTLDGRIATRSGDSKWISSEYSRYIVHKLRAKVDAVIIGKNTFINDNPSLNARFASFDKKVKRYFQDNDISIKGRKNFFLKELINSEIKDFNPALRVVIGLPEKIELHSNIFADNNYLFFARKENFDELVKKDRNFKQKSDRLNIIFTERLQPHEEIESILSELKKHGIMLAMLEGGGILSGSFFNAQEIDQFLYFISPIVVGNGISPIISKGEDIMSKSLKLHDVSSLMIDEDILYNGYKEPYNFKMI